MIWEELIFCKTWGFNGSDHEEFRLLEYKNSVRTSQETHYFSATNPSRLMLWKVLGPHVGDYEECPLLWYKTPVLTSQETNYFSITERSLLTLCKIWRFTAVTMKNAVSWTVKLRGSCKNRRFGGPYRLHYQGEWNKLNGINVSIKQQPKHIAAFRHTASYSRRWHSPINLLISSEQIGNSRKRQFFYYYFCVHCWGDVFV
jgi:hypothetical protein